MQLARLLESETAISALTHYLEMGEDGAAANPGLDHE
jgi:hypothetical protein